MQWVSCVSQPKAGTQTKQPRKTDYANQNTFSRVGTRQERGCKVLWPAILDGSAGLKQRFQGGLQNLSRECVPFHKTGFSAFLRL